MKTRREFIQQSSIAIMGAVLFPKFLSAANTGSIMTVTGPIHPSKLKFTLSHEHILVDFIGADKASKDRYNAEEVFKTAIPFLKDLKNKGCDSFVDCTPAYLGRDAVLLQRLSKASGLNILTNTGYYGAVGEKYLPEHAFTETAEQIAERWIKEWKIGIDGTDIKPGFIKTSVDKSPITPTQSKIIDAAALTHLATGLTIAVHTGDGKAANEQLEILGARGVSPSARIWVHAQAESNHDFHIEAAKRGSWISFDGINQNSAKEHLNSLQLMKKEGLLGSVLVSHDSGWYNVGEAAGGNFKSYNYILTHFISLLKQNGFSRKEIATLFIDNPAKAFVVAVRKSK